MAGNEPSMSGETHQLMGETVDSKISPNTCERVDEETTLSSKRGSSSTGQEEPELSETLAKAVRLKGCKEHRRSSKTAFSTRTPTPFPSFIR